MSILFATGVHRRPTNTEVKTILGSHTACSFSGRVFSHDPDNQSDLLTVGTTSRGHAVKLNRRVVECDRLVLLGSTVYHYHAGFGGGRKSLVPGVAGRETVAHNHSLTLDPGEDRIHPLVQPGVVAGNPVAEEMLEGARMCPPDFIVNTVLSPDGRIAGLFPGNMEGAHAAACRLAERIYRCDIPTRADFVIAWAGSAANWIQSHKALYNASRAVKPDGRIVLVAPCREGLGDERFRYWARMGDVRKIFAGLRLSVEILGQTALSTRMLAGRTVLITRMTKEDCADLGIRTEADLETAVACVLSSLGSTGADKPTYYLMPEAWCTLPCSAEPKAGRLTR